MYLPFSISYYSSTICIVQKVTVYLSALSLFAGSGSGTIIPDPGKSSGSMRIRIRNTGKIYVFTLIFSFNMKNKYF